MHAERHDFDEAAASVDTSTFCAGAWLPLQRQTADNAGCTPILAIAVHASPGIVMLLSRKHHGKNFTLERKSFVLTGDFKMVLENVSST
ncbi:MAG: hypothetical protein ACRD1C_05375 [Terriglobales bacterium]